MSYALLSSLAEICSRSVTHRFAPGWPYDGNSERFANLPTSLNSSANFAWYNTHVPVTKSATKKLRQDRMATRRNDGLRRRYKRTVLAMRKHPTPARLIVAMSLVDRAAKRRIIHANKAGRINIALARLLP